MYGFVLRGKARDVFAILEFLALLETSIPYIIPKECITCGICWNN